MNPSPERRERKIKVELDDNQVSFLLHLLHKESSGDLLREFADENDKYWTDVTDEANRFQVSEEIRSLLAEKNPIDDDALNKDAERTDVLNNGTANRVSPWGIR